MARDTRARRRNVALGLKALSAKMASLPEIERETVRGLLAAEIAKPLRGGNLDLPLDSLWGDSHLQKELFT